MVGRPSLLCVLRFGQGIGFGGEWGGAALLAVENAPPGRRALYGIFPQLGAPVGFITANLGFLGLALALSPADFQAWGWRIPFLASAALVGVGLYVRLKLTETPVFKAALEKAATGARAAGRDLHQVHQARRCSAPSRWWPATRCSTSPPCSPSATASRRWASTRPTFLLFECVAVLFMGARHPALGLGRRPLRTPPRLSSPASSSPPAIGLLMGPMLGSGQGGLVLGFLCLGLFAMGWLFGPMGALLPELFPTRVRYTGASVTYNLAGILGASAAPYLAQRLSEWGGIGWVGLYLAVAAGVSFVAVALMEETGIRRL